jgi:hypothetical protein
MKLAKLLAATAVAAAVLVPAVSNAETVTTRTYTHQKSVPDTKKVNFSAFDINGDGILSKQEVGARLFESFDGDKNGLIDNIEFDRKNVMTIIPMESETLRLVDYDSDGLVEKSTYSYTDFIQQSGLARFDNDMDGLSAREFLNGNFQELDLNDDNMFSLTEWKRAYANIYMPRHAQGQTYND